MHGKEAVSPDLMLGYAGLGSFLLRFAKAASASDLIFGPLNNALRTVDDRVENVKSDSQAAAGIHSSLGDGPAHPHLTPL
jgi:hypothetical protein